MYYAVQRRLQPEIVDDLVEIVFKTPYARLSPDEHYCEAFEAWL